MKKKPGRPPLSGDLKRANITIRLSPEEAHAFRELSRLRRQSLGVVAGDLFLREYERERKKPAHSAGPAFLPTIPRALPFGVSCRIGEEDTAR